MSGIGLFSGIMALMSLLYTAGNGDLASIIRRSPSAFEQQCEREHGRVVMIQNGAYAAGAEQRKRIQKYIADHAEMAAAMRDNLQGYCAVPGMNKVEVRLLMNGSVEQISNARELSRIARRLEGRLNGRVDEAWLYETDTYFFTAGVLVAIEKRTAGFDS